MIKRVKTQTDLYRTDQILCSSDPAAIGLMGDVTLPIYLLLVAGFIYRPPLVHKIFKGKIHELAILLNEHCRPFGV